MAGLPIRIYNLFSHLSGPFWRWALYRRILSGKERPEYFDQRFGIASLDRPKGVVLWVHGLGIGEAAAMLAVIKRLRILRPDLSVLLTTNTKAGAEGLTQRGIPERVIYQHSPIDHPEAVSRFLAHWRPNAFLLAELDLWPYTLSRLAASAVPMVMANARLTDHRFQGRRKIRPLMRDVLQLFSRILVQESLTKERMIFLGADPSKVEIAGILKAAADPLPVNQVDHDAFAISIADRPVWLAAATEEREVDAIVEAHKIVRQTIPEMLLILAPRQMTAVAQAAQKIAACFGTCPRRSAGQFPEVSNAAFLADSIGEMGLWYRLTPRAFVGHSLPVTGTQLSGKNPFEAAALGVAVLHGPCTTNFSESYDALAKAGASISVSTPGELATALLKLTNDSRTQGRLSSAALTASGQAGLALDATVQAVLNLLPRSGSRSRLVPRQPGS